LNVGVSGIGKRKPEVSMSIFGQGNYKPTLAKKSSSEVKRGVVCPANRRAPFGFFQTPK
jgi:hypothetical protein